MSRRPCHPPILLLAMGLLLFLLGPAAAIASEQGSSLRSIYDARAFGAAGDGKTVDTKAIQSAVDAAAEAGGGTVCLHGGVFLSGTICLRSNVTLHIEAGAILRGSRNIEDYPDHTPQIIYLYRPRFTKSLLYAERAENIALTGRGTIDGQGEHFPARPGDDKGRPYILRFSECQNVRVRDLTFHNSARWLSHYLACANVAIDGITIRSRIRENRDGIDIDSCDGVRISNCDLYCGDDAIVLKATAQRVCRRVTITNCVLSSMASALKLGTESNGGFEDIVISNCSVHETGYSGIGLMSVDGGTLQRICISNISMADVKVPIFIRLGNRARPIPGAEPPGMGAVRNIIIRGVQASNVGNVGCSITGIPGHAVENVTLQDIRIRYEGGGTRQDAGRKIREKETSYPSGKMFGILPAYGVYCRHVKGLKLHNLDLSFEQEEQRPAIVCDDVAELDLFGLRAHTSPTAEAQVRLQNVRGALIHGCRPEAPMAAFARIEGKESAAITILGNDLQQAGRIFSTPGDVSSGAVSIGENILSSTERPATNGAAKRNAGPGT